MVPSSPARSPGSASSLRAANQQRVLDLLRRGGGYAQAELARATGLAPATVSNIVRDLAAAGLVETESGSGRRGGSVRLAGGVGLVAGVDFGHSHVAVAIGDLTGAVLAEERRSLPPTHAHDESLALARTMVEQLLAGLGRTGDGPLRVGLGVPAPLSENVILAGGILPGWQGIDVRSAAEEVFAVPVQVDNDANLGALAEHRRGGAQGHRSSAFVKISSGVGVGLVLDDRLFRGANGTAGEIGHLTLDESGPLCRCGGRGCLETYTAAPTVLAMTADLLPDPASGLDGDEDGAPLRIDDVVSAAAAGHGAARRALEDAGLHLGWGLATVVNLLNPEVIVVGGDMARAGDLLLESVRVGLRRHALDTVAQTPVIASELDERASLVGAVLLAAEGLELGVE